MITISNFKNLQLQTTRNILGGASGTTGSGSCGTTGGELDNCSPGSQDCKEFTYSDDCDGRNRVIETEEVYEGSC